MRTNPERFKLRNVVAPAEERWPELRLCIDTAEDYAMLREIFNGMYTPGSVLRVKDVVAWLKNRDDVVSLNAGIGQKKVFGKVF
jgi:spore coat polysaccharide biosynthesis protein SpsF (cytidylyltransferase family)